MKPKPLVDKDYLLEKFPGKGGWTYARIPEILQDKKAYFGWVKVHGWIDNFEIKSYNLMPMGNGQLFLPVRAEIRKSIGKQEGDMVRVMLYADNSFEEVREEFLLCLMDEPLAKIAFENLSNHEQKDCISYFVSSKNEQIKIERMAQTIDYLLEGKKPNY